MLAHNVGRNPLIESSGIVDFVNNIMHVPRSVVGAVEAEYGSFDSNWVGNYVQASHELAYGLRKLGASSSCNTRYYLKDNINTIHKPSLSYPEANFVLPRNNARNCIVTSRFSAEAVTTTSPFQALNEVLDDAGAVLPVRDAIDKRVVNDVKNKIYRVINDPSAVGGWLSVPSGTPVSDTDHDGMADNWELTHFGTLAWGSVIDSSSDFDGDGYTDLEEYLNGTNPR